VRILITPDQLTGGIIGAFFGILAGAGVVYRYLTRTITPAEARDIYTKAKDAIDDYNRAIADGPMTTEEKLKVAEKTLSTLATVIKALES